MMLCAYEPKPIHVIRAHLIDSPSASNSTLVRPIMLTILNGNGVKIQDIHELNGPNWNNLVLHRVLFISDSHIACAVGRSIKAAM